MPLVWELFGALVLAVDAALYFRWGDAGVEVGRMHPVMRRHV